MRVIIESEAIREIATNLRPMPAVEAAVHRLESLPADAPWSQVVEADLDVHRALVAASGSSRMLETFDVVISDGWRPFLLGAQFRWSAEALRHQSQQAVAGEHRRLLRSIEADPPATSVERFRNHLGLGLEELLDALPDA